MLWAPAHLKAQIVLLILSQVLLWYFAEQIYAQYTLTATQYFKRLF